MPIYNVKCADGRDRNCYGTVDSEIEVDDLNDEQLD
jgi:hypothetical protein